MSDGGDLVPPIDARASLAVALASLVGGLRTHPAPSPTLDARWLRAGVVALVLGVVASGFSPPALFELTGRDYERWVKRFAAGQEEVVVDVRTGADRIPYILPGPADGWAGGRPHRLRIQFSAPARDSLLVFSVPDAHEQSPPRLAVSANGHAVGRVAIRRGKGLPPPHAGAGPAREYVVRIPATVLDPTGQQSLVLTNLQGSWATFSALALHSDKPTFAFGHYLDLSPPPRFSLPLLAVGLVALLMADGRPVRHRRGAIVFVAAGLGLLAFLEFSSRPAGSGWHVVLTTHRVLWLLLVLGFITRLGPQESWAASGLLLFAVAVQGLRGDEGRRTTLAVHLLGIGLVFTQPWIPEASVAALKGGIRLHTAESEYSHLEVIEIGNAVHLAPQLRFTHTILDEDRVFEPIITYGLLPSYLTRPRTMLHLGMGGGALARLHLHAHPEIRVHGVDIDPEMIRLGRRFLGLRDDPRLSIYVEDGRTFLSRRPDARYDVVVCDLFQGGVFVPYYTLTHEFFELVRDRLQPDGVAALFVASARDFRSDARRERYHRLFASIGNTLAGVFPSVFFYPVPDIGFYFVATRGETSLEAVRARLEASARPEITEPLDDTRRRIEPYRADPRIPPLTDDLAPVDQLIYDAFFRG